MDERPIILGDPAVRAILEGRKTQTRLPIKNPPRLRHLYMQRMWGTSPPGPDGTTVDFGTPGEWCVVGPDYPDDDSDLRRCPFGAEGTRLWVREAWKISSQSIATPDGKTGLLRLYCSYRAGTYRGYGQQQTTWRYPDDKTFARRAWGKRIGWRPSVHMSRWASRITL